MAVTLIKIDIARGGDDNNLSAVWRKLLKDRNIVEAELDKRIDTFIGSPGESDIPSVPHEIAKADIRKELARSTMSWSTFTRGLTILGINDITMLI